MGTMTCDAARDELPELLSGALDGVAAVGLERHLQQCERCREERAILALVQASPPEPPLGLEVRLARAVRNGRAKGSRRDLRPVAIAAGTAFAVLTGGLLLRGGSSDSEVGQGIADVTLGWPVLQDPILRATPALHDLSVEELESLLAELES